MSNRILISKTELSVYPLCLGGNVFGWSADAKESEAVLNEHFELGGNFIDTADVYSEWAPGHKGGESETVIGNWMQRSGKRDETVIATKVSKLSTRPGLSRDNIVAACEDSLRRLQTDHIDLYYAHDDDKSVSLDETLSAFDELVRAGKIRYAAASNYSGERLLEAATTATKLGVEGYVALQNNYNLLDRAEFETDAAPAVRELGISAIPYFGLAKGFLTGKYQPGATIESVRAGGVLEYQNENGYRTLATLTEIAGEVGSTLAAVALAWLRAQPEVATPIASARTVSQLRDIMPVVELSSEQLRRLGSRNIS